MDEILKGLREANKEGQEVSSMRISAKAPINPSPIEYKASPPGGAGSEGQFSSARPGLNTEPSFSLQAADERIKAILDPRDIVGEQYRMLRAKLSQMQKANGIKTVLISSSVPNEGKTLVSCGLATVLAQEPGRRVLLIDADLRKPDIYRNFGLSNEGRFDGFSRVLRGELNLEEAVLACKEMELYFLPSCPVPCNPAELLSSRHLEYSLKSACRLFDWIVIDSPPILPLADTSLLASCCDAVLLVVRANSTSVNLVKEAIAVLGKERFSGVILNRVREIKTSSYYHYYRHHSVKREK